MNYELAMGFASKTSQEIGIAIRGLLEIEVYHIFTNIFTAYLMRQLKVQKYSALAQKINADFSCDEESPLVESKEEQELAVEIEQDLHEV